MAARKPAITGMARPEGIKDDIGKYLFKTAAKAARKKGSKAHAKMSGMTADTAERKFTKQYDKFQKFNDRANKLNTKSRNYGKK